jgi:RNA polymerase sigma-70 factor (ECF subfamily)
VSLESTVEELAPRVLRYCLGRVGQVELAEELAQESLAALVQRWRRFGPPENALGFVFAVARRRSFRALLKRRLFVPLEAVKEHRSLDPDPALGAELRNRVERVRRALGELSPRDREVILLVAAAELRLKEVAGLLGISLSAVKMRLARARQRLDSRLEQDDERL